MDISFISMYKQLTIAQAGAHAANDGQLPHAVLFRACCFAQLLRFGVHCAHRFHHYQIR
jgi:hypothetical protein